MRAGQASAGIVRRYHRRRALQPGAQALLPRLRVAGKLPKVALVAAMRRLLLILNPMLKNQDCVEAAVSDMKHPLFLISNTVANFSTGTKFPGHSQLRLQFGVVFRRCTTVTDGSAADCTLLR